MNEEQSVGRPWTYEIQEFGNIRLDLDLDDEFTDTFVDSATGEQITEVYLGHEKLGAADDLFATHVSRVRMERMDNGYVWLAVFGQEKNLILRLTAVEKGVLRIDHEWEDRA